MTNDKLKDEKQKSRLREAMNSTDSQTDQVSGLHQADPQSEASRRNARARILRFKNRLRSRKRAA